ncbi:MAG: hypothetical protein JWR10_4642 [Rubritepida sp.]|nr:hypothetical protein [Rubritepida sp.]
MAQDPFADVLVQLQAGLVAESERMNRLPVIVAALNLDILKTFWLHKPQPPVVFSTFGSGGQAVVQSGPGGDVLWMDPAASGYRDTFGRFLRQHWHVTASLTNSGYDVDHMYNRARARQYGYGLVRMFLVRAEANRDHGRAYEKQIGAAEKHRHVKIMKLLDGMSELKVLGLPAVRNGLLLPEHHAAAQRAAAQYHIPLDAALQTLRDLCARASSDG